MSTVILKNLYRGGNNIKQMFRDGEKIYQAIERFIFEVDANSLTFDYTGNTLTLTITASDPWTMTKPEWITASSVSGIGNTTVTLTVPQNPTEDKRTGSIIVTCEGRTVTIPVEQKSSLGLGTPLTFEITGDGYINWRWQNNSNAARTIYYSKNGGEWTSITSTNAGVHIDVVSGDVVEFKADNGSYSTGTQNQVSNFSGTTCQFILYGNVMSLIDSTNFETLKAFTGNNYTFRSLFYTVTGLTNIDNLFLPATTLKQGCYRSMFDTCTGLTDVSKLVLPATTLAHTCYNNMFTHCKILERGPVLSATTLATSSFEAMFNDCPRLNYVKCLATTNISGNCNYWLQAVSSTGTFVKKTGVSWPSGGNGIPSGWTVLEADE